MEIVIYAVMDADEQYVGEDHDHFADARNDALQRAEATGRPHAVITQVFQLDDSELAFTTDGSDVWPPEQDDDEDDAR